MRDDSASSVPTFLSDLAEIVASKFALDAPKLLPSTTVPQVAIDETTGALQVNLTWVAGVLRRFEGDREVGIVVVGARFAREIVKLEPDGWLLPPPALDSAVGACLGLMGVPRAVFEKAIPALAFAKDDDPEGFARAGRITEGYDSTSKRGKPPGRRRKPR